MKKLLGIAFGIMLMGLGTAAIAGDSLQVKGSDTMVHLATKWAETYMAANQSMEVAVTGGGSGTGIAALLNGTADVACASRKIKGKEVDRGKGMGIDIIEHIVARDGIAVIVHPSNKVDALSMKQLKKMYIGEYKKWKQVGGTKKKIDLLSRDSSSGTYAFFQKKVLEKMDYSVRARRMPSNSAIVQSVSEDKYTIGYVGLGYLAEAGDKVKGLEIKADEKSAGVYPSQATVVDSSYVINRPLHLYTNGQPTGKVKAFLDFVMSVEGQKIVNDLGFVAIK
ncbi:PstS family phosphate ABC transporter substrate-binding protein [bacterium]|nr:PstS family phosphate ABC transporter substrate-binding protein [bacterium]